MESGDEALVFCGDLVPTTAHLRPSWVAAYDLYPLTVIEEKTQLLAQALEERWILFLEHDPVVAACRLKDGGKGMVMVDEVLGSRFKVRGVAAGSPVKRLISAVTDETNFSLTAAEVGDSISVIIWASPLSARGKMGARGPSLVPGFRPPHCRSFSSPLRAASSIEPRPSCCHTEAVA